ncbi:MAG: Do family serine endopeptidase [bacterium]
MRRVTAWFVLPTLIMGIALGVIFAKDFHMTVSFDAKTRPALGESADRPILSGADMRTAIIDVAKNAGPAVVAISTSKAVEMPTFRNPFFQPFQNPDEEDPFSPREDQSSPTSKATYLGSGFIVSKDGYIVTNAHVVKGMDEIKVELQNGRTYDAKLIGISEPYETAVIKVDAKGDLPTLRFGDSDKVQVGEWVIAIGNPLGEKYTVTQGIISATERSFSPVLRTDVLQTDAAINRGNSGGPLLNLDGEVIGVNTAIETPNGGSVGIGFALPSNDVKYAADQLKGGGKVEVGYLGVEMQNVTEEQADAFSMKEAFGVFVSRVAEDSPAQAAGIQSGDVLTEIDGKRIENSRALRDIVAHKRPGSSVNLKVLRDGKERKITVKIGSFDEARLDTEPAAEEVSKDEWGMKVRSLTPDDAKRWRISPPEGVIVLDVGIGSPASKAGVEPAMVVTKIQNEPIHNYDDYRRAMKKYKDSKSLQVWVKLPGNYLNVLILKR